MKNLKRYWPVFVLVAACLALVLVLLLLPSGDVKIGNGSEVVEDPTEEDIDDNRVSEFISNQSGFVETPDETTDSNSENTDETENNSNNGNASTNSQSGGSSGNTNTGNSTPNTPGDEPPTSETPTTPPEEIEPPKNNISDEMYSDVPQARDKFRSAPKAIEINGVRCAYEEETNTYCYAISSRDIENEKQYCITGTQDNEELYFSFKNELIGTDGMFTASGNDTFDIAVFSDYEYMYCKLRFSAMPIMSLETENRQPLPTGGDKNTVFLCTVTLQDPDADIRSGSDYFASYGTVHLRGASSLAYPKKSLKLELQKFVTDETGNTIMVERKKPLLGMRDDDDWVLDANYIDPTMMHNYLSYNLWKQIGGTSNPDALLAGPNCQYVEVILNGKYHGLYLLVEPVDEKQMGVQRSENTTDGSHGVYIKTNSWIGTKFNEISGKPGTSKTWMGFEIKYPESGIKASDWEPLYNLLNATATLANANKNDSKYQTYVKNFKQVASKYLSRDNIVNYWILNSVTLARDNAGKNIHWSIPNTSAENPKLYINAWDMDNSFGYRYGGASSGPVKDPPTTPNYADEWFVLLKLYIEHNVDGAADYLKSRWSELTMAGEPCSVTALQYNARSVADRLVTSGAFAREQARWPKTNSFHASCPNPMETELEYMLNWIEQRIPIVDQIVNSY